MVLYPLHHFYLVSLSSGQEKGYRPILQILSDYWYKVQNTTVEEAELVLSIL